MEVEELGLITNNLTDLVDMTLIPRRLGFQNEMAVSYRMGGSECIQMTWKCLDVGGVAKKLEGQKFRVWTPINAKAEVRGMTKVYPPVVDEADVYGAAACCPSGGLFASRGPVVEALVAPFQILFF
jgi:hypothetical protein